MGWILCCVITVTVTEICLCSVPSVVKIYGAHLKASAAMVRLRLYAVLALLPPNTYEGTSRLTRCSRLASTGQYWYNSWLCTGMWKVGLHNQLTRNERCIGNFLRWKCRIHYVLHFVDVLALRNCINMYCICTHTHAHARTHHHPYPDAHRVTF